MNTDLINALADLQQVIDSMKDEADMAICSTTPQAAPVAAIRDQALEDAAKAVDLRAEAFGIDMYGNKNAFHHSAAVIRAMKGAT